MSNDNKLKESADFTAYSEQIKNPILKYIYKKTW